MFDTKTILLLVMNTVLTSGAVALDGWLDSFFTKEPEWHKTLILTLYRLFSVHGAELAADTTNPYDDAAVAAVIAELKKNADKHGITVQ